MPEIQWTGLPAQLPEHLFERAKLREITVDDLFVCKSGGGIPQKFPRAAGTKTSVSLNFVEEANTRKLSL
jgi:hypothetical protein